MASRAVQHRQQALEPMQRKLTEVVSEMNGNTGLEMLRALLAGARASQRLASHRDRRGKHAQATIAKAVAGHGRAEPLFAWQQAVEQYAFLQQQLPACAQQIEACLQTCVTQVDVATPPPAPARQRRARQRHAPDCDVHGSLVAMTGGDLTPIDGIDALTALTVLREIGLDRTRGPTGQHGASWLGLWPGNQGSGGKRSRLRSTPTAKRAASALRLAAQGVVKSPSALGAYDRRMRARLGAPKAMTATAHQLARLVYSLLRSGTAYVDAGQQAYEHK